jgi:Asp-tRNA(Asn)/Glu-tRNA(Gln) amidotransferase A subunit family amidase
MSVLNPRLNAIVTLDGDGARQRAVAADAAHRRGESWGHCTECR